MTLVTESVTNKSKNAVKLDVDWRVYAAPVVLEPNGKLGSAAMPHVSDQS